MTRFPRSLTSQSPRSGLAPLELTLSLPFLLVLMALMINFGVIGSWKVRTQGNAHYAVFRTLLGRTGDSNPPPDNWPNATLNSRRRQLAPHVGQLWDADPRHGPSACRLGPRTMADGAESGRPGFMCKAGWNSTTASIPARRQCSGTCR